jgi:dienelactone hydrolase
VGASFVPVAGEIAATPGVVIHATDTLAAGDEPRADARECLDGLCWKPVGFDVALEQAIAGEGDLRVRFPSPVTTGPDCVDDVWLEWYQARAADGDVTAGPACVVVHESGGTMRVGRLVARGLAAHGIHAFMVQLPYYGARRPPEGRGGIEKIVPAVRQAVADVRRSRDAVASLPLVDAERIAVQGTSLGGFVTATVAGLDPAYDKVFILLAGGDLAGVLERGKGDAERVRRFADCTWIYSGKYDDVVPPAHSQLLAEAAGLPADHHVQMEANHYSGIIYLPMVLARIAGEIHAVQGGEAAPSRGFGRK